MSKFEKQILKKKSPFNFFFGTAEANWTERAKMIYAIVCNLMKIITFKLSVGQVAIMSLMNLQKFRKGCSILFYGQFLSKLSALRKATIYRLD